MADSMATLMHGRCGPGGLHCYCCNTSSMKKNKAVIRRWARRKLKDKDRREQDA